MTTALLTTSFACCVLSFTVNAEIYKHIDEQGHISYSDSKPLHATESSLEKLSDDKHTANIFDSSEQSKNMQASEAFFEKRLRQKEEQAKKAKAMTNWRKQLRAAQLELKLAKQAKKDGVVAEEGDFIARVGGGARPSANYFKKLEQLDANVVIAKQKLATIQHQKPF